MVLADSEVVVAWTGRVGLKLGALVSRYDSGFGDYQVPESGL